ncbi:MAG: hypothetical protein MJA83_00485 [Gammaproteobacteria bacterium]|nr:hypothetical protein [Gammaproteobacteria bacterium]
MRTRYFDFRAPDSTFLLNNRLRGIFQSGVYLGFNAQAGTSGLNVTLTMDSDPDNSGQSLGKIITPDGVVIEEDADLVDVATGFAGDAVNDRIDFLVATYIYNAGLPNNDVTYEVIQGTAGSPPTPPTLTDDQVLIAEIRMPPLASTILNSFITDVNRKNLFAQDSINFEDILAPGVYRGYHLERGTQANDLTVRAGVVFTKEEQRVQTASDQVDLFTLTSTSGASFVRWDAVVLLHMANDLESNPPEFLVVEGTEVDESGGTSAVRPTPSEILAAATAFDPKFTSSDEITVLGFVRVGGVFPASFTADYYHTPRFFPESTALLVRGTSHAPQRDSSIGGVVPFPFSGPEGLLAALDLVEALNESFLILENNDNNANERINAFDRLSRFKVLVQGEFQFGPSQRVIPPENCEIEGIGEAEFVFPPTALPNVILGGFFSQVSTAASGPQGVPQAGAPATFERYEFDVVLPSELTGITDLDEFRLSDIGAATSKMFPGGNAAQVRDAATTGMIDASVDSLTTSGVPFADSGLTLSAFLDDAGSPFTSSRFLLWKRNQGLKNVRIRQTGTANQATRGGLYVKYSMNCEIDNVSAPHVQAAAHNPGLRVGKLETNRYGWEHEGTDSLLSVPTSSGTTWGTPELAVSYDEIRINAVETGSPVSIGDTSEQGTRVGSILLNMSGLAQAATVSFSNSSIGTIDFNGGNQLLTLALTECIVGNVFVRGDLVSSNLDLTISGGSSFYLSVEALIGASGVVTFSGTPNTYGRFNTDAGTITTTATTGEGQFDFAKAISDTEVQHNIVLGSDATFSWTLGTTTLTSSGDINVLRKDGSISVIPAFSLSLPASGAIVAVTLGGTIRQSAPNLTAQVFDNPTELLDLIGTDPLVVAARIGDRVFFRDGTVVLDGQSIELGTSPPPDNSVTRAKMTDSAWEYVNTFARDYFDTSPVQDFSNSMPFINSGSASLTYTSATGVMQYGAAVDLSNVQRGDAFLDSNGERWPILAVDDGSDNITLPAGLTVGTTVTGVFDGAIARGNAAFRNTGLVAVTYTETTGVIQYASPVDLDHISPGYLFVDGGGTKYLITAVNDAGNNVTVLSGITDFDNTVSTELDGSIETNNNPRGLALNDMRPAFGLEELVWTEFTVPRSNPPVFKSESADHYEEMLSDRRLSRGRFGVSLSDSTLTSITGARVIGPTFKPGTRSPNRLIDIVTNADFVEFTVFCSGIMLATTSSDVTGASEDPAEWEVAATTGITVDGRPLTPGGAKATGFHRKGNGFANLGQRPRGISSLAFEFIHLAPGVHTFRFEATAGQSTVPATRIWVFNRLFNGDTQAIEQPGRLWRAAKAHDHAQSLSDAIPAIGSRGGRLVRYIPDSNPDTKAWAASSVPEFETTGDVNSNTTISNVASTSGLAVGDLIRVEGASIELHVIADIPAPNTITTVTAVGFTEVSVDIKLRGSTFLNPAPSELYKDSEIENTFSAGDFVNRNLTVGDGGGGIPNVTNSATSHDGYTAWDEITNIAGTPGFGMITGSFPVLARVQSAADNRVRIGFVGTGIDLIVDAPNLSSSVTVRIDGTIVDTSFSFDIPSKASPVGKEAIYPIVSGLNYGYHTIELRQNVSSFLFELRAFRTYRQKNPSFQGIPIFETNKLADFAVRSEAPSGSSVTDMELTDEGVIQFNPLNKVQPTNAISGWSIGGAAADTAPDNTRGLDGGVSTDNEDFSVAFWGDVVTIRHRSTAGAAAANVFFLDNDNSFAAPSAVGGFTVTGADTLTIAASETQSQTWSIDDCKLHLLRVQGSVGNLGIRAIEVHQPYYSPVRVSRDPVYYGVPHFNDGFEDARLTRALKEGNLRVAGSVDIGLGDEQTVVSYSSSDDPAFPISIPSRGGLYKLSVEATLDAASQAFSMISSEITGSSGSTFSDRDESSEVSWQYEDTYYFPPGFHAYVLKLNNITGTMGFTVRRLKIHWEEVGTNREVDRDDFNSDKFPVQLKSI